MSQEVVMNANRQASMARAAGNYFGVAYKGGKRQAGVIYELSP
jgi:hypothetical protein